MQQGLASWQQNLADGRNLLIRGAAGYSDLLRSHIMKENTVLFVLADRLLQPLAQAELVEQFEDIENTKIGVGTHERLHGMIDQLLITATAW
jgi:hemerythrin-like domain-containing protein